MQKYSDEFKKEMVKKMLMPGGPTPYYLEKESGVSRRALSVWLKQYVNLGKGEGGFMKKKNKFTGRQKFKLVIEFEKIKEEVEKGEFLRKHGLHTADIVDWKLDMLNALDDKTVKEKTRMKNMEAKKIKVLERELNRKEKALAESAALLFLKKKADEFWGEREDD